MEKYYMTGYWVQFATASLMHGFNVEIAARRADQMMEEYKKRFEKEEEKDGSTEG